MSVEKSVTLSEVEYQEAIMVAMHQHRSFSAFGRHCINMEVRKRIKDVEAAIEKRMAPSAGKAPQS